jgi:hypothetical protein
MERLLENDIKHTVIRPIRANADGNLEVKGVTVPLFNITEKKEINQWFSGGL